MNRARYLLSNINLMNIILTVALICFINYMLLPFLNRGIQYSLPVIVKHEKPDSGVDNKAEQIKTPSPLDYAILSEQNLFHPERKIPVEVKEAQPLPKPDFVLYGTLISGDMNIAYMEDMKSPYSTPGREKRQTPLKQGDSMSGFTLKKVSEDRVIMARGDDNYTIYLNDPSNPKTREASEQKPATKAVQAAPRVPADARVQHPAAQANGFEKRDFKNISPLPAQITSGERQQAPPQRPPRAEPRRGGGLLFRNR